MNKHLWKLPAAAGILMIVCAAGLCARNIYEDHKAGQYAETALTDLKKTIPAEPAETAPAANADDLFSAYESAETDDPENTEDSLYCGYLTIPALDIELPVMQEWNYENLRLSPCRYSGSVKTDDLIIAAHNYRTHFGRIYTLTTGDAIILTDLHGREHPYAVSEVEIIDGFQVDQMLQRADSEWDLTLFTCTLNSQSRVTVRAVRTPEK